MFDRSQKQKENSKNHPDDSITETYEWEFLSTCKWIYFWAYVPKRVPVPKNYKANISICTEEKFMGVQCFWCASTLRIIIDYIGF